jgi:hypothetical protein
MSNMMFYDDSIPPNWDSMWSALHAKDSYVRLFGTTVGLGGVHRLSQTLHSALITQFRQKKDGSPIMEIDLLKPISLLDETLTYPTVTGLSKSFDLQALNFKAIKLEVNAEASLGDLMNHILPGSSEPEETDATDAAAGKNLEMKFNVKLTLSSLVEGTASFGCGSPIQIGYRFKGKVDEEIAFGLEALTSQKTEGESSLQFKLNFPQRKIVSKVVAGEVEVIQDVNGKTVLPTVVSSNEMSTEM